jgi:dihydrofolate reductase
VRELRVDMFSTLDGYGSSNPPDAPYWGYGAPGLFEWIHRELAEDHVMLMGATTYRQMSEIVANGDDPTFPRMAELPKIVFSKTLKPPLTWARTTVVAEPVEVAVPALKAIADGLPMRTIGSPSLVRSLFRLGLVDRVQVMVFPTIRGATGTRPVFEQAPDLDLRLITTSVIDDRLVLLDYRVSGAV